MGIIDYVFGKNGVYFHKYPDHDWSRKTYKNDKLHGQCEYGHAFRTTSIIQYENNLRHGPAVYMFDQSKKYKTEHYLENQLHGPYQIWNYAQVMVCNGRYNCGQRDGIWQHFDDQGNLRLDVTYDNGQLITINYCKQQH